MKISKQTASDLFTLIDHVQHDISYDAGGTFALNPGEDEQIDKKAIKSVQRAINFILHEVMNGKETDNA